MPIKAKIMTGNAKSIDGKVAEVFSTTIIAEMLSNTDHLIATINSVIKNNLLYECKDGIKLVMVIIYCNDHDAANYIREHLDVLFGYSGAQIGIGTDECGS